MRVGEARTVQGRAEAATAAKFDDALRRARERQEGVQRGRTVARAGTRPEPRKATVARAEPERATRRGARCEDERAAAGADPVRSGARADVAPVPELAALVRTLPLAVAAARARDGAPLSLAFGRSLDVDLRSGAAGLELVLRPEPRLLHAAEAELPRIVAALRVRGVAVARAEVRPRADPQRRAR
jgi:hypothetical protein